MRKRKKFKAVTWEAFCKVDEPDLKQHHFFSCCTITPIYWEMWGKKSPHTWCRFTDSSTKILKCSKRFKNPRKAGQLTKDLRHYLLWVLSIWEVKGWRYRFCTGRHKEELMSWQNRYINKIIEFTCTGSSRSYYTEQTESLFSIGFSCLYSFCLRCSLPTFTT